MDHFPIYTKGTGSNNIETFHTQNIPMNTKRLTQNVRVCTEWDHLSALCWWTGDPFWMAASSLNAADTANWAVLGENNFYPPKLGNAKRSFLPSSRFNLFQVLNGVSNGGIIQWQVELNYTAGLPKGPRTSFYINYFTKVVYKTLFKRFWQVLFCYK